MTLNRHTGSDIWEADDEDIVEPFKVTPGFIAFVTAMLVPAILAIFIFIGATLVADDVYAAEAAQEQASQGQFTNSPFLNGENSDVPGWKKSLVGICPLH